MTTHLPDTVALNEETSQLVIIDQRQLPGQLTLLHLTEQKDIWEAIYLLKVRGAPAIGIAAAYGLYLAAKGIAADSEAAFFAELEKAQAYLASSRPTAVNLFWALERMMAVAHAHQGQGIAKIQAALLAEAHGIRAEDEAVCRAIGEHGLRLIKDGDGILTHCNAGQLATSKYGTALAPIYLGTEAGMKFRVFVDETRPLLQGARLTAYEMVRLGVDATLICDNMASIVMKSGQVDAIFVGCDRVAANGDMANKIGTSGVAILAKHYGIPFYVCAPTSTIDPDCPDGDHIPIEERPGKEVSEMWYAQAMAPEDIQIYNPAFDVTDASLITAFVTEHGIIRPPYHFTKEG